MPYFRWVGVDNVGTTKKGKQAAHSSQDLSERLLKQGVALLSCKIIYTPSLLWPITAQLKGNLFQQKAKLLRAGLLLPKVFSIVAQQSDNPLVYDILFTMSHDIQQGVPFVQALKKYSSFFDPIVMVMLTAGYESGDIMSAMENVALYFHKQYAFRKSIRAALAMPLLTLLFFIGITCFIFVFIIPRFADMFSSLQQELPPLTSFMLRMSEFVCSSAMVYLVGGVGIAFFVVYYYFSHTGKKIWNSLVIKMSFIGSVIWQYQISQALQALSLLVKSGITLKEGLTIISKSVGYDVITFQFETLLDDVASGQLLSHAMATSSIFLPEVIAIIHIGEETGSLGQSFEAAAAVYHEKLDEQLRRFVFFLQPTVIILLGFLVTTLIFAVYLPIMQLSRVL
ncbi:MAG TPA: type II secretion system F family protein [Candidatus Babeliales bacterium]|jgi:type IV pilus assembly protein PilC|nr:type II secretion system F family protein [Candidatus Babeliales bacterium]